MNEPVHFSVLDHTDPAGAVAHLKSLATSHLHGAPHPGVGDEPVLGYSYKPLPAQPLTDWGKDVMHGLTRDQGFSFHNQIGDGPTDGFMVSVNKKTEQAIPVSDLTPESLGDYRDVNQQALADPDNYLGGWSHKGKVYLDISRHVGTQAEALALARQHNQLGIYDLKSNATLMTADYPMAQAAAARQDRALPAPEPVRDLPGALTRQARLVAAERRTAT